MSDLKDTLRKGKTIQIIVLVDNRDQRDIQIKRTPVDFKGSAFKQTQIDPQQSRFDEDSLIFNLKRRITVLQRKVNHLELQYSKDANSLYGSSNPKKKRRKFHQLARKHICHYEDCLKLYGSETSLKNHLKLKHKSLEQQL